MRLSFWIRVQGFLRAKKISQEKFAQLVGMNYNSLRSWIYNNRMPDAESACDMADILGVSVEYLVRGKCRAGSKKSIARINDDKTTNAKIKKLAIKLIEQTKRLS